MSDQKDTPEVKEVINAKHGKAENTTANRTPKNGDETRTLSSQYPSAGIDLLDAIGAELHLDRAATIRWMLNYTMRRIVGENGKLNIPADDKMYVPHASMIEYCLFGIKGY